MVEKRFRTLLREEEEEDMDDEEDLKSANSGRKRKEKKDPTAPEKLESIKVIDDRRKRIKKFLINYDKALNKALKNNKHAVGLIDLAKYLLVLDNLLNFTDREVILKSNQKVEEDKKHVLFPVEGTFNELTSFNSALLNLVGKFISVLNQNSFGETTDHYSQKKMERYKLLCKRTTLFTLAAMRSKYNDSDQKAEWYDIMAYNIQKLFGNIDDYAEHLVNYEKKICLKHFSMDKTKQILNKWKKDFNEIDTKPSFFISDTYGICKIIKLYHRIVRQVFLN
ncbi:MAG: hypothetical protein IPL20_00150 [Saprospiraceae bacterium]|nr:hypothetical protein [Saprospiraceae bacterium]